MKCRDWLIDRNEFAPGLHAAGPLDSSVALTALQKNQVILVVEIAEYDALESKYKDLLEQQAERTSQGLTYLEEIRSHSPGGPTYKDLEDKYYALLEHAYLLREAIDYMDPRQAALRFDDWIKDNP